MFEMMTATAKVAAGPTEAVYTSIGGQTFIVPAGVTRLCGVFISPGGGSGGCAIANVAPGGGGGGGMVWFNDLPVTAGDKFTFAISNGGNGGGTAGGNGASGSKMAVYLNGVLEFDLDGGSPSQGTASGTTDYYPGSGARAPTIYLQRVYANGKYALRPGNNGLQGGVGKTAGVLGGKAAGYTGVNLPTGKGQSLYGINGKDQLYGGGGDGVYVSTVSKAGQPGQQGAARFMWTLGQSFPNNAA